VTYEGVGLNFDMGIGLAVAYPGWSVGTTSGHSSGWSESNKIFASAPFPFANGAWEFGQSLYEGSFFCCGYTGEYGPEVDAGGSISGFKPSANYGWGGGCVHNWHWGSDWTLGG
jgi:hypothetical protein